jgi:hypothetical protein
VAVPIAAMADIAFFLIVFFMNPTTVAKDQAIDLGPPAPSKLEEIESSSNWTGIRWLQRVLRGSLRLFWTSIFAERPYPYAWVLG